MAAVSYTHLIADAQQDPGDASVLRRYAERSTKDRTRTLAFSDGLAKFTSDDAAWLRPLRSAGLLAGDDIGGLQGWLVGGAMGYRSDVPKLCRKESA